MITHFLTGLIVGILLTCYIIAFTRPDDDSSSPLIFFKKYDITLFETNGVDIF